jgi:hypothetical protein
MSYRSFIPVDGDRDSLQNIEVSYNDVAFLLKRISSHLVTAKASSSCVYKDCPK